MWIAICPKCEAFRPILHDIEDYLMPSTKFVCSECRGPKVDDFVYCKVINQNELKERL